MLTAFQARQLKKAMQTQSAEVVLFEILEDIAQEAIDPRSRSYVNFELKFTDEARLNIVVGKLKDLGYEVKVDRCIEDGYTDLRIDF